MITYVGDRVHLAGKARLVEDSREFAWAEKHVRQDEDIKWVLGNYVEADSVNSNGHIFPLEDLKISQITLSHKPMNMLHQYRRVVGHFAGAELQYPLGEQDSIQNPYVEALGAFYRYYFPDEYKEIEKAHAEGSLFFSMEAVPKTLTCATDSCGQQFAYKGRIDKSYCDHLQEPLAARHLNQPHFKGGAIIIPPVSPGWSDATVKELSSFTDEEMEPLYEACKTAAPHLTPRVWEDLMMQFLAVYAESSK